MNNRYNFVRANIAYNNWRGAIDKRRYGALALRHSEKIKDHKGNTYTSIMEMCKKWKCSIGTFLKRTRLGEPLRFILEHIKDIGELSAIEMIDHTGKKFKSKKEMCEYWGIKTSTFSSRVKKGMSIEEALTTPLKTNTKTKGKTIIAVAIPRNNISLVYN